MAARVRTLVEGGTAAVVLVVAVTPLGPKDVSNVGTARWPGATAWRLRQGELGDLTIAVVPNDCSISELMSDLRLVRESCTFDRFLWPSRVFIAGLSTGVGCKTVAMTSLCSKNTCCVLVPVLDG